MCSSWKYLDLRTPLGADSSSVSCKQLSIRLNAFKCNKRKKRRSILNTSPPPAVPPFCSFLSFAKPTVNIKLPKPQSERVSRGGIHILKHMHFQFPFCSVIKSSNRTNHGWRLRPPSLRGPHTSTRLHYLSRNPPLATNNLTSRVTKHIAPVFTCFFYWRKITVTSCSPQSKRWDWDLANTVYQICCCILFIKWF